MADFNGFLDSDQTIINFAVRELGGTFAQTIQDDPSRMLRKRLKCRRSSQNTAIGSAIFGGIATIAGVFTGAGALLIAGVAVAAGSGFLVKHHSSGAAACELESEILDSCRPILGLLSDLEQRGANPSDLVSVYDRLIRAAASGRFDVADKQQLQAFFQTELEQSAILSNLSGASHGLGATMKATSQTRQPSPQIEPAAPGQSQDDEFDDGAITAAVYPPQNGDVAALPRLSDAVMPQVDDRFFWTKDLLNFPAVLIWGAQGSGKTSFTAWLLRERIKAGHTAEVWDVHREYGQWDGLPVFGDGMDYEAIDRQMLAFEKQVKADYQKRATDSKYSPKRHTVICEEFTNFARRCEHSAPFFEASLSDLRKVKKGVIFVSHGRSLAALGGSQGFAQTRNSGLLELQLEAKIDPATGDPMPAMRGKLKLPGKAAIEVEIAPWMNGSMNFTPAVQSGSAPVQTAEPDGSTPVQPGSNGSSLNPGSNPVQWLNRCLGAEVQDSEPNGSKFSSDGSAVEPGGSGTFTTEKLTAVQARERIAELKAVGMNQTQIILSMWRAKKGANKAYQDAITEYKFLSGETIE